MAGTYFSVDGQAKTATFSLYVGGFPATNSLMSIVMVPPLTEPAPPDIVEHLTLVGSTAVRLRFEVNEVVITKGKYTFATGKFVFDPRPAIAIRLRTFERWQQFKRRFLLECGVGNP